MAIRRKVGRRVDLGSCVRRTITTQKELDPTINSLLAVPALTRTDVEKTLEHNLLSDAPE